MTSNYHQKLLALAAIVIGAALPAQATLLVYEGFNYTSGANITGLTGGTGFAASSSYATNGTTATVASSGLSYTGIDASYTHFAPTGLANNLGGSFRNHRNLDMTGFVNAGLATSATSAIGNGVNGTLWGSFLASSTAWSGGSGSQLIVQFGRTLTGTGEQFRIAQWSAGSTFQILNSAAGNLTGYAGNTSQLASTGLSTTQPTLFVFRIDFSTSGSDQIRVWVNPAAETATPSIAATTITNIDFNQMEFRSANANGALRFDEFRMGTTFADVVPVPEPSAVAALTGLGALGVVALRRRSRA